MLIQGWLQVGITLVLVAGICLGAGFSWRQSLAIGGMFSLSSTAVVLRLLMERGELESPHGTNALGILLVQDLAVVPLALMMAFLTGGAEDHGPGPVAIVGGAVGLVIGLYLILHHLAAPVLRVLSHVRHRELTVVLATVVGLGSALAAHAVGVSPALGAFLAGMLLGGSPFATQVRADVAPARILLLTVFFGTAGMLADPLWIAAHLSAVLSVALLVILLKLVVIAGILRALHHPPVVALTVGFVLAHVGEFAFVLGSLARDANLLDPELDQLVVSVTILTMLSSAALVPMAPGLSARLMRRLLKVESPRQVPLLRDHHTQAVVVGFGPAGQVSARACVEAGLETVVVDLNPRSLAWARELGMQAEFGDATQVEVLEHAGVASAEVVIVTIPHVRSAATIVEQVRAMAPSASVLARSRYQRDVHEFALVGAHLVIGDEEQVGLALCEALNQLVAEKQPIEPAQAAPTVEG